MQDTFSDEESELRRFIPLTWETEALYHEISRDFGMTDSALDILYLISYKNGTIPLSDIVRYSGLQKQTINSSLRNLEKKGLVVLNPVNRKMKSVTLTEKGSALCDRTVRKLMEWENDTLSLFSKEEMKLLLRLITRYFRGVSESLEKYRSSLTQEKKN